MSARDTPWWNEEKVKYFAVFIFVFIFMVLNKIDLTKYFWLLRICLHIDRLDIGFLFLFLFWCAAFLNSCSKRIEKEKGVQALEDLMFDEDPLVRRAGTEAMCNMIYLDEVCLPCLVLGFCNFYVSIFR